MSYLLLMLASLLSCAGQLCQKQAAHQRRRGDMVRWLMLALFLLGCAMLVWLQVLQRLPVGIAYPMLSLNFILVTLAARLVWQEEIDRRHQAGIVLIVIGIVLMGMSE
ncbi:4-amino-4-deoxy-L-arabinose-phospho-UDP flippase [Erwinia sp. OLTSP20]|uniref:4-amino-4-deoxy-L-arabinose-phosphoundecaprenol flippase subunit ArnE n=1 Tax=unclassified Erwinia TaxID=2622719 RepID=UPI000C1862C9|nr:MULTISPECIES: 4-amino-4-deoxy-L-arabinose-phosphoundecaprenol flippase subunit ArnE [unclassified Erwinia]PIJ50727.1 4-amino-4-deoxy-L-arabinose-phospho-UDP flippase [Erwinia sp. OAMSP11]PIJ75396.1 4-amino-4-deoxy-L-arabinose-phospho-UDP flippase [Erwinia sp. OLSSP12]PIJ81894.1 4-amino-4-deoxy-L-arabinose-phospho-UDP flippase [Erwinia sp. OLCASP19]PIJ84549.1 4-amino-4-deoxy-L-arabinose-phospho-UDP flippase [Erwinia sp. OLMTSP26]PIJ86896.1 4-amino-4-deoxy-L-arabinose-phospho-UDP flippase [Er